MVDPKKKRYFYLSLSLFAAISASIVLFFVLFRMQGIGEALNKLSQILSPFISGGVVAYLLRPMCNFYEEILEKALPKKWKETADTMAILGSLITMVFIVYALIAMIVPQVYESVITLWNAIPSRINQFYTWVVNTYGQDERFAPIVSIINNSYEAISKEVEAWTKNTLIPQVTNIVTGFGSSMFRLLRGLYNLLIGIIVAVYVLSSRKRFARQGVLIIRSSFSERWANAILNEIALIDKMFGGFIDAKILDSAIIGVLCYIGCSVLRIPNTLLISVFIGCTNVIPFFGPFIGAVPATLLILMESPLKSIWFILFVVILQQLDGNVIGPRIMGNRIGLSGFWVMFAIIFFGGTWGLVGMVIGVPLFAVIYDLVRKQVKRGLYKKGKEELWHQYTADFPNTELPDYPGSNLGVLDEDDEDDEDEE